MMATSGIAMVIREMADACTRAARCALRLRPPGYGSPSQQVLHAPPSWLSVLGGHRLSFANIHSISAPAKSVAETVRTEASEDAGTAAAAEGSGQSEDLIISENCVQRLREIQEEERQETGTAADLMLRLSVDGGGCSGFQYSFSLDRERQPDDKVFEKDGVKVVVDSVSYSFVKGATVDYVQELVRSAFHVASNPNSAATCGCGSSFTSR